MTCCTPSRVANSTGGPAVVQPPHPSSPTPVGSENRARFGAAKTFVGTAGPVIPEDGEAIRRVTLRAFELELTTVTNARFSALSRRISSCSALVTPSRVPASTSACSKGRYAPPTSERDSRVTAGERTICSAH